MGSVLGMAYEARRQVYMSYASAGSTRLRKKAGTSHRAPVAPYARSVPHIAQHYRPARGRRRKGSCVGSWHAHTLSQYWASRCKRVGCYLARETDTAVADGYAAVADRCTGRAERRDPGTGSHFAGPKSHVLGFQATFRGGRGGRWSGWFGT
eukprot:3892241-Rhodomonas_salina.4